MGWRGLAAVVVVLCAPVVAGAPAHAAGAFGDAGGFNSVLAVGAGEGTSALALARNQATGETPASFTDQLAQYSGISRTADTLTASTLGRGWKNSSFRSAGEDVGSTVSPRPGVTIVRDPVHFVPRIYGTTRSDVLFGAGYAVAQDRMFLMDVLRHTAQASTSEILGPSAAAADSDQLTHQDSSPAELRAQFDALPRVAGAEGAQGRQDYLDYVDGINAFISATQANPALLPAEYPALGVTLKPWKVEDSLATAVFLIAQFTSNGGGEVTNAELRRSFISRFGRKTGTARFAHFRARRDPEAVTITPRRFQQDSPGKFDPKSSAIPDLGSVNKRNAIVTGPGAAEQARANAALPSWARSLAANGLRLPHHASNALLVAGKHSVDGRPLAAMGPQVGYYTPQIFDEYELHGPGIDVSGVVFPGAAPYVLIGHGRDFAWTGTTPNADTVDTFAEQLCNPDGSRPTTRSVHYLHKGKCIPFLTREQTSTTPVAPASPEAPQTITLRAMRSVHGTVNSLATVGGRPVAYTEAHQTAGREFTSLLAFKQLAENRATDGASFQRVMRNYVGEENWFYVGRKDIAWIRSGQVPRHARGVDADFPVWGTGQWDWRGILPPSANPREINPKHGFLASWNNKEAPNDPAPPATWSFGPVHRQELLVDPLKAAQKRSGGKVRLVDLARISVRAATADLRGTEIVPWLRRVLGTPSDAGARDALAALETWSRRGAQRRDTDNDGIYDESPAIAVMDAWWPQLVRTMFQPSLGALLVSSINDRVNPLPARATSTFFFDGWWGYVQKDLRRVLGRRIRGWPKRSYCGAGSLRRCRDALTASLVRAAAEAKGKQVRATCPEETPPACDQIVPTTAGAIGIDPFPFHNRGTFHQVVEVGGSAP
jgi:acyl-homoserine lactone acylase PvdQ